jgi:hypothetical protein
MNLENLSTKFKRIVDSEGAIRMFKIDQQQGAEKYIDEAVKYYKEMFSDNVKNIVFHYFSVQNQDFVLIIDTEGRAYKYDCQNKKIIS